MAIHKNLKKRLSEEQIEEYIKWEERWKGKRWYGEDGNKRFDELLEIVLPGYKRKGEVTGRQKKVLIECSKGHDWEVKPTNIILGKQCLTCSRQKQIRDVWDVYHSIFGKYGVEMDITTYESVHKPAKFKCRNGTWFWGTPDCVGRGKKKCQCEDCKKERGRKKRRYDVLNAGCDVYSKRVSHNLDKLQKELFGPKGYKIREGIIYVNNKTPLLLICPKGHECKISVRDFKRGTICRYCFLENQSKRMSGENNPNYNHNKTEEERERDRTKPENRRTRIACFQRDNYTCRVTGKRGILKHHHIDSYNWCIERRYDLNNVVTLIGKIHEEFHNKYGWGNNTRNQFIEYLKSLIKENRFPERKQHILALIDWIEETRDKMDFSHLEVIKEEGTSN